MDATAGLKKAIADRKASQAKSLKVLDAAVKDSKETRLARRVKQYQTE